MSLNSGAFPIPLPTHPAELLTSRSAAQRLTGGERADLHSRVEKWRAGVEDQGPQICSWDSVPRVMLCPGLASGVPGSHGLGSETLARAGRGMKSCFT